MGDAADDRVRIVILGSGTPVPIPHRMGPSLAIVQGDASFFVDAGVGCVRRSQEALQADRSLCGLELANLRTLFLTHLHSDHTLGVADLLLTPWVMERESPLRIFGPRGTLYFLDRLQEAFQFDKRERICGIQPQNETGWRSVVTEIGDDETGEVYRDERVAVTVFPVVHGQTFGSVGYRFDFACGKSVVCTGDCGPGTTLPANGVDALVHEVYAGAGLRELPADWVRYHTQVHTSAADVGRTAKKHAVKRLIMNHVLLLGATEDDILREAKAEFDGDLHLANDLDVYQL